MWRGCSGPVRQCLENPGDARSVLIAADAALAPCPQPTHPRWSSSTRKTHRQPIRRSTTLTHPHRNGRRVLNTLYASPDVYTKVYLTISQSPQGLEVQTQLASLHANQRAPPSPSPSARVLYSPAAPPVPLYTRHATVASLQPALMLRIVYACFPDPGTDPDFSRLRRTLFWLAMNLRAVNRSFWTASMHVLRSSYLPAYNNGVRRPYSSDPFPQALAMASAGLSTANSLDPDALGLAAEQRETAVLDRWMLLKVRDDVLADESELHLDLDASRDVFDMLQPRARLEDLVRQYGVQHGVVTTSLSSSAPGVYPFAALSISFETRRVTLQLTTVGGRRRVIVEVTRSREETLENTAARIVQQLVNARRA